MNNTNTQELGLMVRDEKVVVSSRAVAEAFGKEHKDVMRAIRNLETTEEFRRRNFAQSSYLNEQQRDMPEYLMTRDGFTFLAMGFTGPRAAVFKEAYINAFNKMEAELNNRKQASLEDMYKAITTPDAIMQIAANWKADRERMLELEAKVIEDYPKVVFHDTIQAIDSEGILVKDMAALLTNAGYKTGTHRLFAWLREQGYLCKNAGYWNKPKQWAIDAGFFVCREGFYICANGETHTSVTPLVTPKGQKHIIAAFTQSQ